MMIIAIQKIMTALNRVFVIIGSVCLIVAALLLSYSVLSRTIFHLANDWQDEASLFCLVASTFLCSAYVQEVRGHVGISAIASILPEKVNKVRSFCTDLISCVFIGFFAWKSWTLTLEAYADHQVTNSSWAPVLWFPYSLMAIGMSFLALQIFLQLFQARPLEVSSHSHH
jgi:TRAP-type C4-dicarboxylate transport system permease small subunit